jgi:hypothetical protein
MGAATPLRVSRFCRSPCFRCCAAQLEPVFTRPRRPQPASPVHRSGDGEFMSCSSNHFVLASPRFLAIGGSATDTSVSFRLYEHMEVFDCSGTSGSLCMRPCVCTRARGSDVWLCAQCQRSCCRCTARG